ncbi:MAG: site-2 protease family protein, partial [Gemmatimonadota bacterium]
LGFEIRIDYSWFVIFFLVLWSFSAGVFPAQYPELSSATYIAMGAIGTLLFFASLLAHELSHSVVARMKGIPVEGITLFIFGGMARTSMESETPEDELAIAGIGPLASLVIAALFGGLWWIGERLGWSAAVTGVSMYLGYLNVILAVFNLLPGFPLDGGRLFRALIWKLTDDLTKATRWASNGGKLLGYLLMGLGILQTFAGAVLGGLWMLFIGWFLRGAAEASYTQHILQRLLEGIRADTVMTPNPESVTPDISLRRLVDERFLRRRYQSFPVVDGGRLIGLITLKQVKDVPREAWDERTAGDTMTPVEDGIVVEPAARMTDVLKTMQENGTQRLLVASGDRLDGIISSTDIAGWVQRSQELEGLVEDTAI